MQNSSSKANKLLTSDEIHHRSEGLGLIKGMKLMNDLYFKTKKFYQEALK